MATFAAIGLPLANRRFLRCFCRLTVWRAEGRVLMTQHVAQHFLQNKRVADVWTEVDLGVRLSRVDPEPQREAEVVVRLFWPQETEILIVANDLLEGAPTLHLERAELFLKRGPSRSNTACRSCHCGLLPFTASVSLLLQRTRGRLLR